GMIITLAHMRTEYMKILASTFDFRFLQAANTLWAVTFCIVLNDLRMIVVLSCWVNFTCWLLQETYLRKSYFIVGAALGEWLFFVALLPYLSLELVDDVHHCNLFTASGHKISTKDVLANVIGAMAMLFLRNLYRRCRSLNRRSGSHVDTATLVAALNQRPKLPPLQMRLTTESIRFDPRRTLWPRIGTLRPLATWKIAAIYSSGAIGALFAVLSLFLSRINGTWGVIAVVGLVSSLLFSGIFACCCQCQLLKRIVLSFHFIFLATQTLATGFCIADVFSWEWAPSCGVASLLLLVFTILTVDALTPSMKRRLQFKFWMPVAGIILFFLVEVVLLVDVLVVGYWDLQDRVFLELDLIGRQAQFRVVPFFLSRIVTIFVWSARYVNIALTRHNDNVLILLRGEVEFDYEGWKRQSRLGTGNK
ncbi:hypothetical protein PHYSODRAFT_516701, partial [Phytophthora sojae]